MRNSALAVLGCALMLAMANAARAGDSPAARALVDKAIAAQGGEAKLAKLPAVTAKLKGTFHGFGKAVPFTGELAAQGADRHKLVIEGEEDGQKFRLVQVLDVDKGWIRFNDDIEQLDKEDLYEAKEEAYAEWVATLVPLGDKKFGLASVGEINIDKRPALGVVVSSKDHRDVNLYFDKQTGLLVKSETRVKDDNGQEVTEETFFSDYMEVQGTRQAMKFTVQRDGKLYMESEVTDCRLTERLDDSVFAKP